MTCDVLDLRELDQTQAAVAGGKGAHLGELLRIEAVHVPPGFCVTTDAFRRIVATEPTVADRLERLSRRTADEHEVVRALSAEIRAAIETIAIPADLAAAITAALARFGIDAAYAVRSSADAEDTPTASFAGQHDSYLNVVGGDAVLQHVSRCWGSLFSERAVTYRLRNGVDHRTVRMAVVVQRMVFPQAAGVLFTADPVSGHRKIAIVEAVAGLGEALVSGVTTSDLYKVRDGQVITVGQQRESMLTTDKVLQLAALGRRIEAHFGRPQDIEWCLAEGEFHFVQSRPITTLFPIPHTSDGQNHVYLSVGHQQMMTDPMKPLGLSFWNLTTPRPMSIAGGRLFVDVTQALASPADRANLLALAERSDPLTADALRTVLDRGDFIPSWSDERPAVAPAATPPPIDTNPAIVAGLIARSERSIAELKRDIDTKSGVERLDFILADLQELRRILFEPQSMRVIMAGMEATWWLNDTLQDWLGEKNAADTLSLSVPNNVTSEMGLALLDVADVVRPHPDVVAFLERVEDERFLDELPAIAGGREARDAILSWLDRYGMRGVGEIDITRPRWRERPHLLLPILLGHVRNAQPGDARRRFEQGQRLADQRARELIARIRALPDGERKAEETRRMIDRVRTFIGYREYPKYGKVSRYFVYKQALLEEAGRLVHADVLREQDDIFYLTYQELHDVVRTNQVDHALIRERKEAYQSYRALTPPRVLTSDGEAIAGSYRRGDVPPGALVGLPVSAGTVEGRARVVLNIADAELEPGDILVTAYTDPSWTPLFVGIKGLVTEVGGLMTHGAVIAREYGLPAIVGVEGATRLIHDGQRIRVHGSDGFVERLS